MLQTYFPILVFAFLGLTVGGVFAFLNHIIGPKKPARATDASRRQHEPYESGIPVEPMRNFRFGVGNRHWWQDEKFSSFGFWRAP